MISIDLQEAGAFGVKNNLQVSDMGEAQQKAKSK